MKISIVSILLIFVSSISFSQQSNDINQSIITSAHFDKNNLTVSWLPKEGSTGYNISYRTNLSAPFQFLESGVQDTFYQFDESISGLVEVSIQSAGTTTATGYILAGEQVFEVDQQKNMMIFITNSLYTELEPLVNEYIEVLHNELIDIEVIVIDENQTVTELKDQITASHNSSSLDYLLLIGNVPVPYSGNSGIDGHSDHIGAWVADGFYGDVDGVWTDTQVNNTSANRDDNKNVPGDGKYDQSTFPSLLEIAVGRVDFSNLPKLNETEVELTRRYLQRNIDYRLGELVATKRAIIDNNFNLAEGFAQGAIKSFHNILPSDSINYGAFSQCTSKDYLWTFGAGGGSYQSAGGIISTDNLVTDSIQSIFTTIFGSYFGDWDIANNLLRASLARGSSLINAWSGRPIWYFHHMAMGKTIGDVLINTQNNNGNYTSQFGKRLTHTSLLGDPSLQMFYHPPVENLSLIGSQVSWEYPDEQSEVNHFTVYYKDLGGDWQVTENSPIVAKEININDLPILGDIQIMIRPAALISSPSGSYFSEGNGAIIDAVITSVNDINDRFVIHPNPTSGLLTIQSDTPIGLISIYNLQGKLVARFNQKNTIDISHLNAGMYTIQVNNHIQKIVKW